MAGGFFTGAGLDDAPFEGLLRASGRSTSLLETAISAGSVLTLSNIDEETDLKVAQNGSAYTPSKSKVIYKNEHKCSLILPMLDLNARCVDPLPFKLPTLDGLADLLQLCALRREQLFYCTLDISNHFWSCRLPPPQRDSIRVGVGGRVYALQSLPFGWKHSPSMAQAILAAYLVEYFPGSVVVIQYADDMLVAGRRSSSVRQQALRTRAVVGWPMDAWRDQKLVRRKSAV